MQRLKLKDEVIVLAGKDKGKKGQIIKLDWKNQKVWVSKINMVSKCVRPRKEGETGGIQSMEAGLHMSNVALIDPSSKKATRVHFTMKDDKKVRTAAKGGAVLA